MNNILPAIKFIGAWACIVSAVVLIALGHEVYGLPGVLAILSIAFSQAPVSW